MCEQVINNITVIIGEIMTKNSLELKFENKIIFSSNGKWLYPLFDLEKFLMNNQYNPLDLILYDKIIGKASALMIIRLGITHVESGILSRPAETVFKRYNINYTFLTLVDHIECKTESLLENTESPEEVYSIIRKRAGLI